MIDGALIEGRRGLGVEYNIKSSVTTYDNRGDTIEIKLNAGNAQLGYEIETGIQYPERENKSK